MRVRFLSLSLSLSRKHMHRNAHTHTGPPAHNEIQTRTQTHTPLAPKPQDDKPHAHHHHHIEPSCGNTAHQLLCQLLPFRFKTNALPVLGIPSRPCPASSVRDVSEGTDFGSMFEDANSFNQPIGDWYEPATPLLNYIRLTSLEGLNKLHMSLRV